MPINEINKLEKEPYIEKKQLPIKLMLEENSNKLKDLESQQGPYSARIELTGKIGYSSKKKARRNISRLGFVAPIYQTADSVVFVTTIGLLDTAKHVEGNIGLGYRRLINPSWIIGGYGFYDIRKTVHDNYLSQATIGAEALSKNIEFRGNVYIPISTSYEVSNSNIYDVTYNPNTNITKIGVTNQRILEQAVGGFDIEAGGSLPGLSRLELFAAHYYFNAKNVNAVIGGRIRGNYHLTDWLSVEGETNYDKQRKVTSYLGLRFGWNFSKGNSNTKSWVNRKMTQLPIRDIDIIEQSKVQQELVVDKKESGQAIVYLPEFRKGIDRVNYDKKTVIVDVSKENVIELAKEFNIPPLLVSSEAELDEKIKSVNEEIKSLAKEINKKRELIQSALKKEQETKNRERQNERAKSKHSSTKQNDSSPDIKSNHDLSDSSNLTLSVNTQSGSTKKDSEVIEDKTAEKIEIVDVINQETNNEAQQEALHQDRVDTVDVEELRQNRVDMEEFKSKLSELLRIKREAQNRQEVQLSQCINQETIPEIIEENDLNYKVDEIVYKDEDDHAAYTIVPPTISNAMSYVGSAVSATKRGVVQTVLHPISTTNSVVNYFNSFRASWSGCKNTETNDEVLL